MNLCCPSCGTTNRVPAERLKDQPVCGRCGFELMAIKPATLTDATFPAFVAHTERPILVDFWAEWCGLYRAGREVARQSGAMAAGDLVRWVQSRLAAEG